MPAKTPMYLKPANGKNGNLKNSKKIRELLSTDMISPPLGDFRHMAHIGRGGEEDRFGDISFMKKEPEPKEGTFKRAASWGKKKRNASAIETQTLDRKPRKRMEVRSTDNINSRVGLESPILKNAVSLPSLNKKASTSSTPPSSPNGAPHNNNTINGKVEERLNASKANEQYTSTPAGSNGVLDGPPKPRRIMSNEQPPSNIDQNKLSPLRRSSQVLTEKPEEEDNWALDLDLDLGPSLLDEVLGIMDRVEV